jgi:hypothetical protein
MAKKKKSTGTEKFEKRFRELTAMGRQKIITSEIGIKSYQQLSDHFSLIENKQSKLTASRRYNIQWLYLRINPNRI